MSERRLFRVSVDERHPSGSNRWNALVLIVAWNVNHRTFLKSIPVTMSTAILSLAPDVIVLTEYVPGSDHTRFLDELAEGGMESIDVSDREARHNQVLIATRSPSERGDLCAPNEIPHARSNFLHIRIPSDAAEVVGLRVPMFKRTADTNDYWTWFEQFMTAQQARPLVAVGDFNVEPRRPQSRGAQGLQRIEARGWYRPIIEGTWSYCSDTGYRSCLDHALVNPRLIVQRAEYVYEHGPHVFAGRSGAMSDHSALALYLESRGQAIPL
jgi:hypothetical protein